jgi:histidinol-phosphate/aromatic aminotransferase/cobyric acid decarboxylase-like protein
MHDEHLRPLIEILIRERARLFDDLQDIAGVNPIRSQANFMLVECDLEPRYVFRELAERDILVRDVSGYPMLGKCLRISVGTPEENDKLLAALTKIMNDVRVLGAVAD